MIEKIRYLLHQYDTAIKTLHSLRMCSPNITTATAGYKEGVKELTNTLRKNIREEVLEAELEILDEQTIK